ncbi:MAG: class I SAM-dependent methyltransferase [Thermoleophilia bacterium]
MPTMCDVWERVAPGWRAHADVVDARVAPVTDRMLARAVPAPGEHVLDVACGPGGAGIAAAPRVAPGGTVVLSDIAPAMVATAVERAAAAGLTGVTGHVADMEDLGLPDASADVVLCREGLMFAADTGRAAAEIARVLRPGGRAAVAVWGPRDRNPWLGVVLDAVERAAGRPIPPPGVPGPFTLADGDRLAGLVSGAGLTAVAVEEVPVVTRVAPGDDWWGRTVALAGPLGGILAAMPDETRAAARADALAAAAAYEDGDGIALPGVALVASGVAA